MGKYVLKTVPATTNNLTTGIKNFLNSEGHYAMRINTQGQWDEEKQIWRKSGSEEGVSDIVCILYGGVYLGIEVKRGRDSQRPGQKKHAKRVVETGGLYFIAKTYDEFLLYYQTVVKPALVTAGVM